MTEQLAQTSPVAPAKVFCTNCRHRRPPDRPNPYSSSGASSPDVLEHWKKWEEHLQEVQRSEREQFQLGLPFRFKPRFYSWCQWWTDHGRDQWKDTQLGEPIKVYELTARRNKNHDCPHFARVTGREE